MPPRISIITPTFNAADTLERAMQSVLQQQGLGPEGVDYWIIDGGSTDGTLDIIERYRAQLGGFISERDNGIADAFNKGIARANGDLIGAINADDWYEPGALNAAAHAYEKCAAEGRSETIVHGDIVVHDGEKSWRNQPRLWGGREGIARSVYFDMPVNHPACFIPRAVYQRLGVYDASFRIAMDVDFILRAYRAGVHFHYLPQTLAHFQVGGASTQQTRLALDEVLRAQQKNGLHPLPCRAAFLGKLAVNRAKALFG